MESQLPHTTVSTDSELGSSGQRMGGKSFPEADHTVYTQGHVLAAGGKENGK